MSTAQPAFTEGSAHAGQIESGSGQVVPEWHVSGGSGDSYP